MPEIFRFYGFSFFFTAKSMNPFMFMWRVMEEWQNMI
nr:MAG TPA: hypothetical protein [Caudoviricetes sp.]